MNSPKFFCDTSETVTNNANNYALDPTSTFVVYPPTAMVYKTSYGATTSPNRLQYVDVYMDDILCDAQGDPTIQHRVYDPTIRSLKEISPSLPGEAKDFAILKKSLAEDKEQATIKEILGWVIDTHWGTLTLSSK